MNEIVNKFFLAGGKFMPEMHLKQTGFTYSASIPFTKNKERIQKFKETEDSQCIYQNEQDKASFQDDMANGDFKDLTRRKLLIKYCVIKHLILLKILNMMDINADLLQWSINFFIKKTSGSGIENMKKWEYVKQRTKELQKPIIRKFKKRKVH